MNAKKPSRRKTSANKLEPIDWREFANDAVLNGNMSTLYRRPPNEDPTAYASPEAMVEIEKRVVRPDVPTVGEEPTAQSIPTVGIEPAAGVVPTVDPEPPGRTSEGRAIPDPILPNPSRPTVGLIPTDDATRSAGTIPTVGAIPTVGVMKSRKIRPIRNVQDALTLAGQVLYRAMLGPAEDARSISCTKGYRQLATETHLDKDTVRDLIVEFKEKGILRETATYDADTRMAKTYEVLSHHAVLQLWRDAGLFFVTTGRQRPLFCNDQGDPIPFQPTVGLMPTA